MNAHSVPARGGCARSRCLASTVNITRHPSVNHRRCKRSCSLQTLRIPSPRPVISLGAQKTEIALPASSKPTVLSSALVIAGNTIGAGLLALPAVTQAAGFTAACAALTAGCVFSMITGLLIAEINIAMIKNRSRESQEGGSEKRLTLVSMAGTMLGSGATLLTSGVYLFRSYALMQAYTSRAGSLISRVTHLPLLPSAFIFAAGGALVCAVTSSRQLDKITSGLVLTMLASFGLLAFTIGGSDMHYEVLTEAADWSALTPAIPIIALSFVFQNSVPAVVSNLDCDAPSIRQAIIGGSLLPLALYISWEAIILGSSSGLPDGSVVQTIVNTTTGLGGAIHASAASIADAITAAMSIPISHAPVHFLLPYAPYPRLLEQPGTESPVALPDPLILLQMGSPAIAPILQAFSLLTLSTSFLGYVQSLTDFLSDVLGLERGPPGQRSLIPYVLAVIPPVALTIAFPDAFVIALSLAGTYGAMVLFGLIPAAMAWNYRYGNPPNFPVSAELRQAQLPSSTSVQSNALEPLTLSQAGGPAYAYASTMSQDSMDMASPTESASSQHKASSSSSSGGGSGTSLDLQSAASGLTGGHMSRRWTSYSGTKKVEEMVPGGMATLLLVAGMAGGVIANQLYETFGP